MVRRIEAVPEEEAGSPETSNSEPELRALPFLLRSASWHAGPWGMHSAAFSGKTLFKYKDNYILVNFIGNYILFL